VHFVQANTFPERGTVYDFCFERKSGGGQWVDWMDTVDKHYHNITPSSKVFITASYLLFSMPRYEFKGATGPANPVLPEKWP